MFMVVGRKESRKKGWEKVEKASAIFELLEFEDVSQLIGGCKILRIILSIYRINP